MANGPQAKSGVLSIAPYQAGKSKTSKGVARFKLSANESPLGASPKAIAAFTGMQDSLGLYPDPSAAALRAALGEVHGLDADKIVCGAGSDELLHLLAQVYVGDGQNALMGEYGFSIYPIVTQAAGAQIIMVPEVNYQFDVDAVLGAVTPETKLVWLANPNNPTGTYLSDAEVRRLHAGLRDDILLVIDNAYAEYVTSDDFSTAAALVDEAENVVMVRTFSKIGLAALRLGWLYGPAQIVDALNRIRGPFNVSLTAQLAGAAAVRDQEFTQSLRDHNAQWRDWLTAELGSNEIRILPSQANFVLALFDDKDKARFAFEALGAAGIIVREMGSYNIQNGLRISVGTQEAMEEVGRVFKELSGDLA